MSEALFFEEGFCKETFERFLDYLRSAVKSIDVAVFSLTHDAITHVLETVQRITDSLRV